MCRSHSPPSAHGGRTAPSGDTTSGSSSSGSGGGGISGWGIFGIVIGVIVVGVAGQLPSSPNHSFTTKYRAGYRARRFDVVQAWQSCTERRSWTISHKSEMRSMVYGLALAAVAAITLASTIWTRKRTSTCHPNSLGQRLPDTRKGPTDHSGTSRSRALSNERKFC